jgi:hypothetical protein
VPLPRRQLPSKKFTVPIGTLTRAFTPLTVAGNRSHPGKK